MKRVIVLITSAVCLLSCDKYLDVKSDKKLAILTTLQDAVALLDNPFLNTYSALGETAADNYYMVATDWAALSSVRDRNVYTWQNTADDGDYGMWTGRYNIVFTANVLLEFMKRYTPGESEKAEYSRVNGAAYFFRGYAMYDLLQLFSKPYDKATAILDPGISIRLSPDINQKTVRASVQESYNQVISDLKQAATMLPKTTTISTRPNKAAAYGALANVYLSMEEYVHAALYADSALQINKEIIDYNTINSTATTPFPRFNKEVIFQSTGGTTHLTLARCKIDSILYKSYQSNDLRKNLFFIQNADKSYSFKGSYDGQNSSIIFLGLTTAEMLLVRAEAFARTGRLNEALNDLNLLMVNRWKKGSYVPHTFTDTNLALAQILHERRKELVMRCRRWMDLRRLNRDSKFAITIKRQINGDSYELPPNDKRYVFPIPQDVIELTGIAQNER